MTDVSIHGEQVAPIIEARGLEKFYAQPDGKHIEVIAPTNRRFIRGRSIAMAVIVVTLNRLVWHRLYRLAETRFKLET